MTPQDSISLEKVAEDYDPKNCTGYCKFEVTLHRQVRKGLSKEKLVDVKGVEIITTYNNKLVEIAPIDSPSWVRVSAVERKGKMVGAGGNLPFNINRNWGTDKDISNVQTYTCKNEENLNEIHILMEEIPLLEKEPTSPQFNFTISFTLRPAAKFVSENKLKFEAKWEEEAKEEILDLMALAKKTTQPKDANTANHEVTENNIKQEIQRNLLKGEIDHKFAFVGSIGVKDWHGLCQFDEYELYRLSLDFLKKNMKVICARIWEESKQSDFDLLDLGVGNGVKAGLVLETLVSNAGSLPIKFFAFDIELQMTGRAISTITERMGTSKVECIPIPGDFKQLNSYSANFQSDNPKLITLLGATLGNCNEEKVLTAIKQVMTHDDFFLLGIEYIAGRDKEDLTKSYNNERVRDFVLRPLDYLDISLSEKTRIRNSEPLVALYPKASKIPGSKSIVYKYKIDELDVILFRSTKYERDYLLDYLEGLGFSVVDSTLRTDDKRYGEIILQIK